MELNPVEKRLVDLAQRWEVFRLNQSKRLLIWQASDSSLRFYQCFFEVQKHETDYTVGDLFIVFDAPFENSVQYSRTLKESLVGQYQASRDDLDKEGIAQDWSFDPDTAPDSAAGFIKSLKSFGSKFHKSIGHLVAVFMPSEVVDNDAFSAWLTRLLSTNIPERLRLVVLESEEVPRLSAFIDAKNNQILVDAPKIDALTTAQETFAQENTVGPAGVFRNYLMGLMTLVEKGSADQVLVKAKDAVRFARQNKWTDQEFVVSMLLAGSLLKEKRFDEAIAQYSRSRKTAEQTVKEDHPAGQKLVLQSWFGEAGTHFAANDLEKAVVCYAQAAVLAEQIPDLILGIEAYRMAAYCSGKAEHVEHALEYGSKALALGERLKPDARLMTTLPIAAVDILRILESDRVGNMELVKYREESANVNSRQKADTIAAKLEQSTEAEAFHQFENDLGTELKDAERRATQEVEILAQQGSEQFQEFFSKGRELLGQSWPLISLMAVAESSNLSGNSS